MKVPRDLSGAQLIKALCRDWDYRTIHQEGSHHLESFRISQKNNQAGHLPAFFIWFRVEQPTWLFSAATCRREIRPSRFVAAGLDYGYKVVA